MRTSGRTNSTPGSPNLHRALLASPIYLLLGGGKNIKRGAKGPVVSLGEGMQTQKMRREERKKESACVGWGGGEREQERDPQSFGSSFYEFSVIFLAPTAMLGKQ